jgi:hypothetical protein
MRLPCGPERQLEIILNSFFIRILGGVLLWHAVVWCRAQQEDVRRFSIGAEPSWTVSVPAAKRAERADASAASIYLLLDRQIDVDKEEVYARVIKRITSESGVQNDSM